MYWLLTFCQAAHPRRTGMSNFILAHEPTIRLTFFLGLLATMATWEAMAPRRPRLVSRWLRWPSNLGIVALNTEIGRAHV